MLHLLVVLIVLLSIWYFKSYQHHKKFPPGPSWPLPFAGDAYLLGKDLHGGLDKITEKYGRISGMWLGHQRAVLVADFDILQDLMNKNEASSRQNLDAIHLVRQGKSLGGPPGVIISNGSTWTEVRRTSLHILKDFGFGKDTMEEYIEEDLENLILHIETNWLGTPLDISHFFNNTVLSSLWRVISGESLKIGDSKLNDLLAVNKEMLLEFANPKTWISMTSVPLYNFMALAGLVKIGKPVDKILDYCDELIDSQRNKSVDGEHSSTFIEAFLHKIQTTEDLSHPLHGNVGILNLRNTLLDMFIAGSDTITTTLNWAMFYMILYPDIQQKVREELIAKIGSRNARMSDRNQTPYTEAVLHEVQRKGSIAATSIFHSSTQPLSVGDYHISKDTLIIPMLRKIMHDPEYFPEPDTFNPERYLTVQDDGTLKFTPHPKVIPFGIGKRRCLGESFARTSVYKSFTTLIQKFDIVKGQENPMQDKPNGGFVSGPIEYKLKFVRLNSIQ